MNIDREGRFDLSSVKHLTGEIPKVVQKGDVLFNNTNSPELIGKTTVIPTEEPMGFSNHMTRIRLENGLSAGFSARQLHFLWMAGYFLHRCKNHVNQASIAAEPLAHTVPFALPPSREQERIADTLDELLSDLDAGVAALERVQTKLTHYRAAVLKAAVEGDLTADWRAQHPDTEPASALLPRILTERRRRWEEDQLRKFQEAGKEPPKNWKARYPEAEAPLQTGLPQLPQGWLWVSLDQLSIMVTSGSRGWAEFYSETGATFVRSQDINTDKLVLDDVAHVIPPKSAEGLRTKLLREDLLVTITGANVAKAARVDVELSEAYVSQHVALIRLALTCMSRFVHLYAAAPTGGRRTLLVVAYGAGKPGLNLDNLRTLPIPLAPLAEQEAIVEAVEAQLSVIDHLEADITAKLKSAQGLRQSILRHAFTGQLVPQDPNDEPASELLKRIATEREERARLTASARLATKAAGKKQVVAPKVRRKTTEKIRQKASI